MRAPAAARRRAPDGAVQVASLGDKPAVPVASLGDKPAVPVASLGDKPAVSACFRHPEKPRTA